MSDHHTITDLSALESLFGAVGEASIRKEVTYLHPTYRTWIEASPFAVLTTSGANRLDASPRGDPAGLVTVQDDHTILLPERRGNNRIDSLKNILINPRVALLFLIPGIGESMRVSGTARICVHPDLLLRLAIKGVAPKCVIEVNVESVFFQCARALQRSKLWVAPSAASIASVPSAGAMLAALTNDEVGGATYDGELPARQQATLY